MQIASSLCQVFYSKTLKISMPKSIACFKRFNARRCNIKNVAVNDK